MTHFYALEEGIIIILVKSLLRSEVDISDHIMYIYS